MKDNVPVRDAEFNSHNWLNAAKRDIDETFGAGYAAAHPELVIEKVRASATIYLTDRLVKAIESATDVITDAWLEDGPYRAAERD